MWLSFSFVTSFFLCVASDLNLRAPLAVKQSVSFVSLKTSVEEKYTESLVQLVMLN